MIARIAALTTFLLVPAACDDAPAAADAKAGKAAVKAGKIDAKAGKANANEPGANESDAKVAGGGDGRFEKSIEKDACKLFTAEVVSKAVGVPATDMTEMVSGCRYAWGKSHAHLWWPKVTTDSALASQAFEQEHEPKTGAEIKQGMDAIQKQLEKEEKEGNAKFENVDVEKAKQVGGGVADALKDGMDYDVVEGVGDKAYWHNKERVMNIQGNEIKSYDNKLDVLVSNFRFQIEVHFDENRPTKDEAIAVAKAFIESLP